MKLLIVSAVLVVLPISVAVDAAPARKGAKAGGQCVALKHQYEIDIDAVSRYMAFGSALGRAADADLQSSVEQKQANALSRARLDIDLLKARACAIPALAPAPEKYKPAALGCSRSMIMARYSDERVTDCNPEKWEAYNPPK